MDWGNRDMLLDFQDRIDIHHIQLLHQDKYLHSLERTRRRRRRTKTTRTFR
jgi:hypothetical protein